ncbi:MAG TPA: alpha/beta fold hydrolase [Leptolyngbyaceae cyanobacterium M33_DOE_097]|uniref:Alpha/beta fold hydrolase n=1 Tax=Oscillatoriales cyanobacterium SpSt-418 TaxID=2282169 RepID=A0A7C3KCL1_9CYAN|nr:alpha/beta fold hydrolase [Leptolyngbyaceae cyanobacterium M33_DOE_097]
MTKNVNWFAALKSLWVGGFIVGMYALFCLLLRSYQTRLMYFPSPELAQTPVEFNLPYEEVTIPVRGKAGGERLHGWWMPARGKERGTILYLHGNGSNISGNLGQAQRLHELGFSVFLFDYRGYGKSVGGFPSEKQLYQDADLAWTYLTQQRRIPPQRITLFGHSLGGAIAIYLGSKHPDMAGMIIQSSFTSMRGMVDANGNYWMLPIDWLLTERYPSIERVRSLQVPVLYIHGTSDSVIPHSMSEALYAATPKDKFLALVPNADHDDVATIGGDRYDQILEKFFKTASIP